MTFVLPIDNQLRDVTLESLQLNTIDADGIVWILQDIEGWWTTAPVDLPDIVRPGGIDGSYDVNGRFAARLITIKGTFIPPSNAQTSLGRTAILAAANRVKKSGVLTIVDKFVTQTCNVRLLDAPIITANNISGTSTFEIHLKAADPRKYSIDSIYLSAYNTSTLGNRVYPRTYPMSYNPNSTFPNNANIVNEGNISTTALLVLNGPAINPSVLHLESNSRINFNVTITQNQILAVDLERRSVLLNGLQNMRSIVDLTSKWFTIAPGTNNIRYYAGVDSTGLNSRLDIYAHSAWI